jgi:SAM-dependent methyltransferase
MPNNFGLLNYYALRAAEYENIYAKPERQEDLQKLKELLQKLFMGKDVLEIACGTGYWTNIISGSARSIAASDLNDEVLEIARSKNYKCDVQFIRDDAYILKKINGNFNAGCAGFLYSHLLKNEVQKFLINFNKKFIKGSIAALFDNNFVEGSSTPISRIDEEGNSFQTRFLGDGSKHEIIKNFPDENEIRKSLSPHSEEFSIICSNIFGVRFIK